MLKTEVRNILHEHGQLVTDIQALGDDQDLYESGLTSLTTVNLMLAIEDHFDVEFDDEMLSRDTFQSINALVEAIETLTGAN